MNINYFCIFTLTLLFLILHNISFYIALMHKLFRRRTPELCVRVSHIERCFFYIYIDDSRKMYLKC